MDENKEAIGAPWSVERRFRVTEVFLAVLWVWIFSLLERVFGGTQGLNGGLKVWLCER